MTAPLLSVQGLSLSFDSRSGPVPVLDRVSFEIGAGEIVGIIGESGSGKTALALAVMGLAPDTARITGGAVRFRGADLLAMPRAARGAWRGTGGAMIFQNPRAALNPLRRVQDQLADVISRHHPLDRAGIAAAVSAALSAVQLPPSRHRALPQELSGGQCQRVGIALALAPWPALLIADEPTTGLDVTTQAAILALIRDQARARGLGVALITHDLALAAAWCDRLVILHAGQMVESGGVRAVLGAPQHPYTAALLRSVPALAETLDDLVPIDGTLPDLTQADLPPCRFAPRCARRLPACDAGALQPGPARGAGAGHLVACRNPL